LAWFGELNGKLRGCKTAQGLNCQIIHHFLPNSAPKNLPFNLPRDSLSSHGEKSYEQKLVQK
jgi:hypothetical protein